MDARATLTVGSETYEIFRLDALQEQWDVARLPYSLRVLLENVLRACSGEDYWQFYVTNFGPVKAIAGSLDAEGREEFHQAWVEFFETNYRSDDSIEHDREYLLTLGGRR